MFDLTSSKLLILGLVALIVVGPKDLPVLLRTLGKYLGMIKRQAAEFRSQFDEAMRDAELQQLKKDVEQLGQETEKAIREGETELEKQLAADTRELDKAIAGDLGQSQVAAGEAQPSAAAASAPEPAVAASPPPTPAELAASLADAPKAAS